MNEYQEIGRLLKTHGFAGDIKLSIEDAYKELFLKQELVYVEQGKMYIPYFIEKIKKSKPFLVKFEEVDNKEKALDISSRPIYLKKELTEAINEKPEESKLLFAWTKGYFIIDQDHNEIGEIEEIIEYPQQEMAKVTYDEKEILIPLNEKLIIGMDEEDKVLMMEIAEGLLDL